MSDNGSRSSTRVPRRALLRLLPSVAAAALAACASPSYGSRMWPVELVTDPPGCEAWIVPNTRWIFEKERILAEGAPALAEFEHVRTPWTGRKPPYVHVFVAIAGDGTESKLEWREFTPSRDERVLIDFTPNPAPPEAEPAPEDASG